MELSQIRTEVRDRVGIDAQDAMATDATLNRMINAALREVANMRDWDWQTVEEEISLSVGVNKYDRGYLARSSTRLSYESNGDNLRLVTPRAAAAYQRYSGPPQVWYVQAGQLVVYPTPTKVDTLIHTYMSAEEALEQDDDEPLVPDYAIDLVIVKAALKVAARTDDTSKYQLLSAAEADIVSSLIDEARRSKGAPVINFRRDWNS